MARRSNDPEPEVRFDAQTFLDEARQDDRVALHRTMMRWILAFTAIFCFAAMAFWWSGSAVRYSAARVQQDTKPTYKVTGTITDAQTHQPVPWAEISTDFQFGGAFFSTRSDENGQYSIDTLAEPQDLVIKANGYHIARLHVGKQWFSWTPHGSERKDAELTPGR